MPKAGAPEGAPCDSVPDTTNNLAYLPWPEKSLVREQSFITGVVFHTRPAINLSVTRAPLFLLGFGYDPAAG